MTLTNNQRIKIEEILREKLFNKIVEYEEKEDMNKEFYFCLFSKENAYIASLLQSTYTWLGNKWEKFAEIIAEENFDEVHRRKRIYGQITDNARSKISSMLDSLDNGNLEVNVENEKNKVIRANEVGSNKEASQEIDLMLKEGDQEYYLELKSVKPNKNEVKAAKSDLLKVIAMKGDVEVFLAMPFNPYFDNNYRRWTVIKFFDEGNDFLIGKNFWDFLGGEGTYEELLDIFEEVGKEVKSKIDEII